MSKFNHTIHGLRHRTADRNANDECQAYAKQNNTENEPNSLLKTAIRTRFDLIANRETVKADMVKALQRECHNMGVDIISSRFQDLMILDPYARAALAAPRSALALAAAAHNLAHGWAPPLTADTALGAISPSIQYTLPLNPPKGDDD